jgi:HEXXH motif-containing protein
MTITRGTPHPASPFDYGYEDAVLDSMERAEALDSWLLEQLGAEWRALRTVLLPSGGLRGGHPRSLWVFFLCAFELAREASQHGAERARAAAKAWAAEPFIVSSIEGAPGLCAVAAHPALQLALDSSWRSDIHGVSLRGLDRHAMAHVCRGPLSEALGVLRDASRSGWDLVMRECAAVAFVTTDPPMTEQGAVSLTVKRVPGLVILSEVPLLMQVEGLVHEAAHLWLNGVERVRPLCADPSLRLATPLRKDPRPVLGLLHQAWVLAHLSLLHDDFAASRHPALASDFARIESFRRSHRRDLLSALDVLEGTAGALTSQGTEFVARMRCVLPHAGESHPTSAAR